MMTAQKRIAIGLLTVLGIAVLVGLGFFLYRLGYEQGARAELPAMMGERRFVDGPFYLMPRLWWRGGQMHAPAFAMVPGLLSGLGILALVSLAVVGLVSLVRPRSRPPSGTGTIPQS